MKKLSEKMKELNEILKNLPVSKLELDELYNECIEHYLESLKDVQADSYKMWKYTCLGYSERPMAERVVMATLEHFNCVSLLECSESIDFTFYFPSSKADELDLETGFVRLLYKTDPFQFVSMFGLVLELQSGHPVISNLISECSREELESYVLLLAENDFKVCETVE